MNQNEEKEMLGVIQKLLNLILFLLFIVAGLTYLLIFGFPKPFPESAPKDPLISEGHKETIPDSKTGKTVWMAPDTVLLGGEKRGNEIRYGRALIANTALYLGPQGSVGHTTNGMNCQNCHLDAGTRAYGNNYSAVASTYPKFRERSGKSESIYKRVNDCMERSLNGKGLDSLSKEMQAIKAYITWLGKDVKKGEKPQGSGIEDLPYLERAADPAKGQLVFVAKCTSCHNADGQGKMNTDGKSYLYPPLWGVHSYNSGAGLFRLSRFAGYVKNNMPFGASKSAPQLTDQEAWDVAAYVNSQERPAGDMHKDWPRLEGKPVDHPFGPFADKFTEKEHKYGPFGPIAAARKKEKKK